ncbi:MAG: ATP-binding cassette domain-containing protein, partial [Raoultibacter sp.]
MSVLEVKNVSFSYGNDTSVLSDFSMSVESHERVALCAPSGFGKTTLAFLLAGYSKPQQGSVLLDGMPLPSSGVCPVQMIWQHPETAVDPRIRMRRTLAEAGEIDPALVVGLGIKEAWMSRYPHELSGGELQRFCIARALAAQPKFLIA